MIGHSANGNGGKFRYYECGASRRMGKASCTQKAISADSIEEQALRQIKEYLTDEKNILSLIDANNEALEAMQKNKGSEIARLRADISRKDTAAKNLMKAVESGDGLKLGHIAARLDELSSEKSALEGRVQELEAFQLLEPIDKDEAEAFIEYMSTLFRSGLLRNKTLFQGLIQKIELLAGGAKAQVTYNPHFHPKADLIELKKKPLSGHRRTDGSPKGYLAPQMGLHANLLGEQIIAFTWVRKRGPARSRDPLAGGRAAWSGPPAG